MTNDVVGSFAPLVGLSLRTLVLGTMPGVQSLIEQRYYAHPRNAFWPIMLAWCSGDTPEFGMADHGCYNKHVTQITETGIGVWDVLAYCERAGSLDSAIVRDTEVANKLIDLARLHPELERVVFNGKTAQRLFTRHILGCEEGAATFKHIRLVSAPSTSPAMATLSLDEKFTQWTEALGTPPG